MLRVEVWMTTTFFAVGVIAAMTYVSLSKSDSGTPPPTGQTHLNSENIPEYAKDFADEPRTEFKGDGKTPLQLGDRYLLAGNYSLALDMYYDSEKATGGAETAILIRQAFCLEQQQHYELAQKKYYRTTTLATNANHRLAGIAGLARCLRHAGHQSEALEMLAEQTLKIDQYRNSPLEIRAQLDYEFAVVLQSFAVGDEQDLTAPTGVAFEDAPPRPDIFLSVIDQPSIPLTADSGSTTNFSLKILQRPSPSLNVITATISARQAPVLISIAQIADSAELELFASTTAQEILRDRSRTIELQASPLGNVMDTLLVSFDLVWYQIDSALYIVAQHEIDPQIPKNQFWFEVSLRAFRRFELNYGEDARRPAALLSTANLNLLQNKLDVAANEFQELAQSSPRMKFSQNFFSTRQSYKCCSTARKKLIGCSISRSIKP